MEFLLVPIFAILNRLRGTSFDDFYPIGQKPNWIKPVDFICAKYPTGVWAGLATALLLNNWYLLVAIAIAWAIGFGPGWKNFDALHGKNLEIKLKGIITATIRSSLLALLPLSVSFIYSDLNLTFSAICGIIPLSLGLIRFISGYLPVHQHSKLETNLFAYLWKGQFELHELIYGALLGLSIVLAV
jgi:hypothetical protein